MEANSLIPELSVSSFEKSMNFYVNILGFKIEYSREESNFAFISFESTQIMIEQINENWETGKLEYPFGRGINFFMVISDIEIVLKRLKSAKYPIFIEPKESWYRTGREYYGCREFLMIDPDGYLLRFAQDIGVKDKLS